MSTIADYSVFTKEFLAHKDDVDFSHLYIVPDLNPENRKAFAVIPLKRETSFTPREAMNLTLGSFDVVGRLSNKVSCQDADGKLIGNVVRIQPGVRDGSIRLVAKVAVIASNENESDTLYNTFVLVYTNPTAKEGIPIAVATISKGYRLNKHTASEIDPLDDVENANYVSFTINNLNGYTSVDFNPDAYATYDVTDALSRRVDGLHIAFDTASGDLKLLDKDGNVLDQANLPIKADVIIADGEEGYKYVKTDVKQDIHAAKAWMPEGKTAWETVEAVPYTRKHAALVVGKGSTRVFVTTKPEGTYPISTEPVNFDHVVTDTTTYMVADKSETRCHLFKVKGEAEPTADLYTDISEGKVTLNGQTYNITNADVEADVVKEGGTTYVLVEITPQTFQARSPDGKILDLGSITTSDDPSTGGVVGITLDGQSMYTFEAGATTPSEFKDSSGHNVTWFGTKAIPEGYTLKYGLEAFVWTVKDRKVKLDEPFFKQLNASLLALGFHEGDDIALGTNLAILAPTEGVSPLNKVDANDYMHGKTNKAKREQEVDTQRANAKEELVAWNKQHPGLTEDREHGTIIDSSGLDVRSGSITLGCGRVGVEGSSSSQKVNYGIQMRDRSQNDDIPNRSESLDFTISHFTGGKVTFDENGHATDLFSSTLLSIESGSYISGAPTCLILAEVTHNLNPSQADGPTVFTPVRMTAGFSVAQSYDASNGLSLTIQDYRDNIISLLNPDLETQWSAPAIIEVQAIYTHPNAETVPAQQMHTYIGEWTGISVEGTEIGHPECRFLCNKIEEWMTAIGLADTNPAENVKLYVVIRVY